MTSKLGKRLLTLIAVAGIAFSSLVTLSTPASAVTLPKLSESIYKAALDAGASKEVAASLIGNIMQESGMRPEVVNPIGAGGLFQMYKGRMTAMKNYASSKGKNWTDVQIQVEYALKVEPKAGNQFMIPRSYSLDNVCATVTGSIKVDCSKAKEFSKGLNMDKYLKIDDIGSATLLWSAMWERPGLGEMSMNKRLTYAQQAHKQFSGVTSDGGSNSDDSDSKDSKSEADKGPSVTNSDKVITDEYELEGMGDKSKWVNGEEVKDATLNDLTVEEQYRLAQASDALQFEKDYAPNMAGVGVSIIGFIFMLWAVLMFAALMFDKSNSIIDVNMTKTLSFGQMEYTSEKEDQTGKRVGMSKALTRVGIGFVIGIFLVSGVFFGWIEYLTIMIQNFGS